MIQEFVQELGVLPRGLAHPVVFAGPDVLAEAGGCTVLQYACVLLLAVMLTCTVSACHTFTQTCGQLAERRRELDCCTHHQLSTVDAI